MCHPLLNEVIRRLDNLTIIIDLIRKGSQPYLSLEDAATYLCMSKSTLYKHTSEGHISFFKPNGKLILFSKSDLDKWIGEKKIYSNEELLTLKNK